MTTLIQLSAQPLVHALGWTLLHFCWQGAAVAAVLWCVLALLGARSSQARYGAACLALALMVALPLATFAHVASDEYKMRDAFQASGAAIDADVLLQVGAEEPVTPWPVRVGAALDRGVPWVLLLWFAGVVVFVGRLNFGLLVARRLKTAGTEPPPPELLQLFAVLKARLGVARAVELLHSTLVQVPTVIGWLRPVVLLPMSCLSGLSPEQIEAVLCHELAHVRRHDYLVSVLQSVIETFLFYHPAVWWVSKQVRRERECCCDELAVNAGGDVLAYARALSHLEEHRAAFPEFVLGANGGVLKMRIKRLLGSKQEVEGSPVAALVVLSVIFAVAASYFVAVSRAQAQSRNEAQTQASQAETASAAEPAGIVSVSQQGATAVPNPGSTQGAASDPAAALSGPYRVWLNQDVLWIITPAERDAFLRLANDVERDKFIEQFWARRDPPGAAAGTFKEQYYARIAYANQHFAANKPGWMTDRGHIYIVYGPPDSIDAHAHGGSASAYPYQVWSYRYIPGIGDKVDLTFVDTCNCGQYHYTIDRAEKDLLAAKIMAAPVVGGGPQGAAPQPAAGAEQGSGSIAGTIVDPNGALVPGAKVTATNTDTGAKRTVETDSSGHYSFAALPPGPYNVEVQAPGFQRLLQENVEVKAGQVVGLRLKLTVGGVSQTATVNSKPLPPPPPPPPAPAAPAAKPGEPQRISAGVVQGLAISQPAPVYPEDAKAKRIQGVVVLQARISKEGTIKDLQLVSGPPALVVSAIDAVQHWKYKPYLIDGEPTEVDTTINIDYTLGPPDMSCMYYDSATRAHAGTCEENSAVAGHYACRADDDKTLVEPQIGCEWKVKRLEDWQHENPAPAAIETTPAQPVRLQGPKGEKDVVLNGQIQPTPNIRSIEYKGLNSVTIQDVVGRFQRDAIGLSLETPYDPARVARAAEVMKQLLAEHRHPNAAVIVSIRPIPPKGIGILFSVKEGPKAAVSKPGAAPATAGASAELRAPAGNPSVADASAALRIKDVDTAPTLVYKVAPEFTEEARKAKASGVVLVNFEVDKQGNPEHVHVLRGVGHGLDAKAVEAVKQYKFKPAMKNNKPVEVALSVEVNFQIF